MGLAVSGGQPLFTLGLPMLASSLAYFLSLPWGPSTNVDFVYLCQKYHLNDTNKLFKNHCRFKTWMGLVGQILIKLKTSFIRGFLQLSFDVLLWVTYANTLVATQWPLKRSPHLPGSVWYGGLEAHCAMLCFHVPNNIFAYYPCTSFFHLYKNIL